MLRPFLLGAPAVAFLAVAASDVRSQVQQRPAADTLAGARPDTTLTADTARADTTGADAARAGGVDTVITYSATDSIVFNLPQKSMELYSKANLRYQQMELNADRVTIDWAASELRARGGSDSAAAGPFGATPYAPSGGAPDTGSKRSPGTPIMRDGGEEYHGEEVRYDFISRRGTIHLGDTKIDDGLYYGEDLKKITEDEMYVKDGRYTTCDLQPPHFHFESPKMKVVVQDKIVAEPVYLYVSEVPVFGLPFGVFPNRAGRTTGLYAPVFGDDAKRGRFLSRLGFYWATNDYMDLSLRSDYYTKGGWAVYSDYRYALRYNFTGAVRADYANLFTGEPDDPGRTEEESYKVNFTHNQEFDPTTRLNANMTFASNNSYRNTNNLGTAVSQNIVSNATLSKSWEGSPNSISINVGRNQDLRNGNITDVIPSLTFNHSQSFPFRFSDRPDGPWFEQIGIGYSANLSNRIAGYDQEVAGVVDTGGVASTQSARRTDRTRAVNQALSLNYSSTAGRFSLAPSISYRDNRTFIENDVPGLDPADSSLTITKATSSPESGTLTAGLSASTKLYGMMQPGIFGISAFRHTFTPALGFSYADEIIADAGESQASANLNLGNVFEIKGPVPDSGEAVKTQLLNLNLGISYNFSADSLNFSPLSLGFRTGIRNAFDLDGGASYDLYQLVEVSPGRFVRVNKFVIAEEGRLARLTSFRIAVSTRLSGGRTASTAPPGPYDPTVGEGSLGAASGAVAGQGYQTGRPDYEPDFSIPWDLALSWNYSESRNPPSVARSSGVRGSLEFNLTPKWKVSASGGYDIVAGEPVIPDITISRDLHCWYMNFYWVPTGEYQQYRFEIRVKAPQLRDLKVTKQGSERGFAR